MSIHLKVGSLEPRAWTAIAVLLALLGVSELLQLQPALTNFGRSTAFDEVGIGTVRTSKPLSPRSVLP